MGGNLKLNKISHSSSNMYSECSEKYNLHYNIRLRPERTKSPLIFGSAIDSALNELLEGKSREEARALFLNKMTHIEHNKQKIDLSITPDAIDYSKADFDEKLGSSPRESLLAKGYLMIDAYIAKVMPRIKKVLAVQQPISIKNGEGDETAGFLDIVAEWEDGRVILLDNKTTSVPYADNSASQSPQLTLYFFTEKERYNLTHVGFLVLSKKINHNEKKICKSCGYDGSGARHATCDNKIGKKRCNGEWAYSYSPEAMVQIVINELDEKVLDQTFDALDNTNNGIANQVFEQNRKACWGKFGACPYLHYCKSGSEKGLVVLSK